jgi:hypothetical protein
MKHNSREVVGYVLVQGKDRTVVDAQRLGEPPLEAGFVE